MPKSRVRKKKTDVYRAPTATLVRKKGPSPRWVGVLVIGLLVLGVAWLVVSYVSGGEAPVIRDLGNWNVLIGFGLIAGGFAVATQWR